MGEKKLICRIRCLANMEMFQTSIRVVFREQEEQVRLGRDGSTLPKTPKHRRGPQPIGFLQNAGLEKQKMIFGRINR